MDNVYLVPAPDDSMIPNICPGDRIEISTTEPIIEGCCLYLEIAGKHTTRRIYRAGNGYKLIADNKDYPPISLLNMPKSIGVVIRVFSDPDNILREEYARNDERLRYRNHHNH